MYRQQQEYFCARQKLPKRSEQHAETMKKKRKNVKRSDKVK